MSEENKKKLIPVKSEKQLTEGADVAIQPDVMFCANVVGVLGTQGLKGDMRLEDVKRQAFDNNGKPLVGADGKPMTIEEKMLTFCGQIEVKIPIVDMPRYPTWLIVDESYREISEEEISEYGLPEEENTVYDELPLDEFKENPIDVENPEQD